jgi:hypothetical protein
VADDLVGRGYAVVPGDRLGLSPASRQSFERLKASYRDLPADPFSPSRYRAHGAFHFDPVERRLRALARRPRQAKDTNPHPGSALPAEVANSPLVERLIADAVACFGGGGTRPWRIDVHAVRVVARPGAEGRPAPEGVHQDGFRFVSVHMIDRFNVSGGVSTVHDRHTRIVGRTALRGALDCVYIDDRRLLHAVTPVRVLAPFEGHRDVLLMSYET